MTNLYIRELTFYSQLDEDSLFSWMEKISIIEDIRGIGDSIIFSVKDELSKDDLMEIIALFFRYGIDMKQLEILKSDDNESWFCNREMYWYDAIFKE